MAAPRYRWRGVSRVLVAAATAVASTACGDDLCQIGECGVDGNGGYCNVCTEMVPYGAGAFWNSFNDMWPLGHFPTTYCDEEQRVCEVLGPECEDGWCQVPAGSFQAGVGGVGPMETILMVPPHMVVLTRPYVIKQTEVTQGEWLDVMGTDHNPSHFAACGLDCPVNRISWFDMAAFANALSARDGRPPCYELVGCTQPPGLSSGRDCDEARFVGPDCSGYRLPSEAEFELAASAGSVLCFSDGSPNDTWSCDLPGIMSDHVAWYCGNSDVTYEGCDRYVLDYELPTDEPRCRGIHPVAQKPPNRLGLYDVYGNVMELTGTVWPGDPNVDWDALNKRAGPRYFMTGSYDPKWQPVQVDPGYSHIILGDDGVVAKSGSYHIPSVGLCSYFRNGGGVWYQPNYLSGGPVGFIGFRLVRTLSPDEDLAWRARR